MMKKSLCCCFAACLLFAVIAGCSENVESPQGGGQVPADVDLTILSSTMAMAAINNIIENNEDYIGKTIKVSGVYISSYYDKTDLYYHYVMIDSCCMGFEFVLSGEHAYPDDYPEINTFIEITGIFGSYEELGQTYYYLVVDDIVIV